ncbi:MAG TPA: hypothetical protein VFH27_14465 [Longimicrobiaceae bacterium]|nr:hypothetical protein [Longimicrobiaceae bacterium]
MSTQKKGPGADRKNDARPAKVIAREPRRVIKDSPVKGTITSSEAREAARAAKRQRSEATV